MQGEIAAMVAVCHYLASAVNPEEELSQLPAGGHHLLILDQLTSFALKDDPDILALLPDKGDAK